MKRIIVKKRDAEEKLESAATFFDAMHFGIDDGREDTDLIFCKSYYFIKSEGNLFERHITILESIPIKFVIEIITERRK